MYNDLCIYECISDLSNICQVKRNRTRYSGRVCCRTLGFVDAVGERSLDAIEGYRASDVESSWCSYPELFSKVTPRSCSISNFQRDIPSPVQFSEPVAEGIDSFARLESSRREYWKQQQLWRANRELYTKIRLYIVGPIVILPKVYTTR